MEQQTNTTDWIDKELGTMQEHNANYEKKPGLVLETGKITTFKVDASKPFDKWAKDDVLKAIIPVEHNGVAKSLWLNVRNPLYRQLLTAIKNGIKEFKVFTTGTQENTRYTIVTE